MEYLFLNQMNEDHKIFEIRYAKYGPQLKRDLRKIGIAIGDVDDLSQTVWLRAWEKRAQVRSEAFQKWINVVAYRIAIKHLKKESRRRDRECTFEDARLEQKIY